MEATLNGPFGQITLSTDPMTIGRVPDNKLMLNDTKASSHHAVVRAENNGYTITDLGSTNGTFVNEQQLRPNEPHQLNTGDTIRVGDTRITYEAKDAAPLGQTIYAEQGAKPAYDPTIAVPPLSNTAYGMGQPYVQEPSPPIQPAYNQGPMYPPPPVQPAYGQAPMYPPPTPSYQQPNAPYAPPLAVAPKKSNRGLFIILGSILGVVILLCLIGGAIIYAARSTPEKTLNTFCSDVQSGDYQSAYSQFSPSMQASLPESQFASILAADSVTSCTHGSASDSGTSAATDLHLIHKSRLTNNDTVTLIKDDNGEWKINSIQSNQ